MKESIGNAFLFNLVIMFVVIMLAFFIGSLSYSKAAKVKNRIIEVIEKNGEKTGKYESTEELASNAFNNDAIEEIDEWLNSGNEGKGIGYRKTQNGYTNCKKYNDTYENINKTGNYEYCVYQINTCKDSDGKDLDKDKCGIYYHVTTYMYFDVPVISSLIKIPVNGETKTFVIRKN